MLFKENMRFNEKYIRMLVREAVEQHYKSYGLGKFDKNKFQPITNYRDVEHNKPRGGLWASPVDAKWDWRDFNKHERYIVYNEDDCFEFKFKPNAKILKLKTGEDIKNMPMQWDNPSMRGCGASRYKGTIWAYPDFEEICKHYDAIEYFSNTETYEPLNGWDCDCVLVLNPNAIEIIKDNPHDKSTKRKMTRDEIIEYDPDPLWGLEDEEI